MDEFTKKEKKIIRENARYFLELQAIHKMDIGKQEAYSLKYKELELNLKNLALINSEHADE